MSVSTNVRASGPAARRLLLSVVPESGRYRDGGRGSEFVVFNSHVPALVAAAERAGIRLDDRQAGSEW